MRRGALALAGAAGLALLCPAWGRCGVDAHLDLLAGGGLQRNPPTSYFQPVLTGFPPALTYARQPFYEQDRGRFAEADLRALLSFTAGLWEAGLNAQLRWEDRAGADPFPFSTPPWPHRSLSLRLHRPAGRPPQGSALLLEPDHAWIRLSPLPALSLTVGRQPVGLATNHYFTPNDVLAPFSPADFLRLYKPGVDAARLVWSPCELCQLELLALAGYEQRLDADGHLVEERLALEWDRGRSGLLVRLAGAQGGLGLGALLGRAAGRELQGLWLEKDLGRGWLLGLEANLSRHRDDPQRFWPDASLALSGQIAPDWNLRAELASQPSFPVCPFCQPLEREQRSLAALGANWESQGLWALGLASLADLDRREGLLTLQARRSLADESELILQAQSPWALPFERPAAATAFELAPLSMSLHLRCFL